MSGPVEGQPAEIEYESQGLSPAKEAHGSRAQKMGGEGFSFADRLPLKPRPCSSGIVQPLRQTLKRIQQPNLDKL